jgi:hypothetical protein
MPFRVKDILIDVVQVQPCPQNSLIFCHIYCTRFHTICHWGCSYQISCHFHPSVYTCGINCSFQFSGCPYHSIACGPHSIVCPGGSQPCGGSVFDPGQIDPAAIRERMKAELAAAQAEEETIAEAMRPQTVEQVDLLEGKLKEAMAELAKRREELKKK